MVLFPIVGSFLVVVAFVSSQQPNVTMTDDGEYAKVRIKPGNQTGPENFNPGIYHPCSIDASDYIMMFNYSVSWEEAEDICEYNGWALATPTTEDIYQHFVLIMSTSYPTVNITSPITIWMGGVNVKGTNNGELRWLTTDTRVEDYFYANWTMKPASTVGMKSQCTVLEVNPSNPDQNEGIGRHETCCQHTYNFMCRTQPPISKVNTDALKCPPTVTTTTNPNPITTTKPNPNPITPTKPNPNPITPTKPNPNPITPTKPNPNPITTTTTKTTTIIKPQPADSKTNPDLDQDYIEFFFDPAISSTTPISTSACVPDAPTNLYPDYTETSYGGSIYTIVREPMLSWAEAKMACESQCSVLCEDIVHTSDEFQFLSDLVTCPQSAYTNSNAVWLGRKCNSTGTDDCPKMSLHQNGTKTIISTDGACFEEHPFICKRDQTLPVPVIEIRT